MADDHRRANALAVALCKHQEYAVDPDSVKTHIVLFDVNDGDVVGRLTRYRERDLAQEVDGL